MTSEDQSVALRSFRPRPEKCCDGAAVTLRPRVRQPVRFPPVELDDALGRHAPALEVRADAERRDERHVGLGERADGRVVEVVVVIVRDDHQVERRQRLERHRHRLEALRAGEPQRRGARSPHRIGQHAHAVDLDQHRRVSEPGGAQAAGGRLAPSARADSPTAAAAAGSAARRRRGTRRSSASARSDRASPAGSGADCESARPPSAATP